MAVIPDDTGEVTAEPQTQGINVHATPEDFGAAIGQGLQQLGAGVNKAQAFYEETAADNSTNNWHQKANSILNGDPNDPNNPGYLNQKGADAMHGYAQTQKDLDDAAQEERANLPTARARFLFDQDTRRTRFLLDQQTSGHYRQQYNEWQLKTNEDKFQLAQDTAAQNPMDENAIGLALTNAREAVVASAQVTRGSNFDAKAEIDKADQAVRLKQFDALRVINPPKALELIKTEPSLRSLPNWASLVNQAQEGDANASQAQIGDRIIQDWTGKASQSVQPPAQLQRHSPIPPTQYKDAIGSVDPKYQGVVGNILAGETVHDPASAGPDGDYKVAGLGQFKVDQWKTVTGQTIAPGDVGVKGKDTRLDPNASIKTIGIEAQQNRDAYFRRFGHEPNAGDLATMHQQGQAGALKLFSALADNKANEPASNYVSVGALTRNNLSANATVGQAVRGIADYYTKGTRGAAPNVPNFNYKQAPGMVEAGNLDPWNRPVLHNPDGSYSTTSSVSIGTDKGETLIPTVVNGKRLSTEEATAHYKQTGENLGTFKTPEDADKFATGLHNAQATMYDQNGQPVQTGQYTSQSDYLIQHRQDAMADFEAKIDDDPAFAGRADLKDRAMASFENRYNRHIRDQNQQYLVDTHQIQSVIEQGHLTSENDVMASSPENAAAWMRLQFENPAAAESMRNWFKANAGGATKSYGTQFNSMLDRVLAPVGDPKRLDDPAQINGMITAGENSILTNNGASVLLQLLNARNQPGGEDDLGQLRNYLAHAKPLVDPLTKPELHQTWPQGQQKYAGFVGQALRLVGAERAQGMPMSQILAPDGEVDKLLARSQLSLAERRKGYGEIVHDVRAQPEMNARNYLSKSIDINYLKEGIAKQTISPMQASQAIRMGARSKAEVMAAYNENMITFEDAIAARDHLNQYHRNFWGQPEQ